jgi:hypothetical protein
MKTLSNIPELEARIEQLVREHIEATRAAAAAAVVRAFGASAAPPPAAAARRKTSSARRSPSRRRAPEEVAELAERLCAAVHTTPGATMTTLAAQVGATPRELAIAVARLRRQDRVRTVGQRQHTKYFPVAQPIAVVGS